MVNPSGSLNTVRCGMCGKENAADSQTCQFCGARLRPMTPEELGLTPSTPPASTPSPPQASEPPRSPEPPRAAPSSSASADDDDPFAMLRGSTSSPQSDFSQFD